MSLYLGAPIGRPEQGCKNLHLKQSKRSQVCIHSLQQCPLNTLFHIVTENLFVFLSESNMSQAYCYVSSIVNKAIRWQYILNYSEQCQSILVVPQTNIFHHALTE